MHTPKRRSTTDQFIFQRRTPAIEEASTGPSAQPQDDTSANIVGDSPSPANAETGADTDRTNSGGDTKILQFSGEQGDDVTELVNLEDKTTEIDEGQAGSEPGKTLSLDPHLMITRWMKTRLDRTLEKSVWLLLDQTLSPRLKFPADEHVILEDPLSSTGTLSSIKNLDDEFTIGDQFINDKATEYEPEKLNVESEVVSMVTVPIYQASSSVPPLYTLVIDLSPPKLVSSSTQAPILTATTATTTTTLPLPPPPQQQSTTDSELAARVIALEKKFPDLEQKSKNLATRLRILDLGDLPEADMKEMLHQRVFETGSYKSLLEHVALYEALEASMEHAQRDEFLAEKDKEAPSSSSKQQSGPHSEQPVEDILMPDAAHISDSEDTDSANLPKIKPRLEWLKPILEEDRPETPEPDWSVPLNDLHEPENNWANALAKSYKDPAENKLLQKTGDMGPFIKWFCKRLGKKQLSKSDLEGPTFKVAKASHENSISLQFQMEECHWLLMDQVDLVNPEGHRFVPDVSKSLPLGGPSGQVTIQQQFFFNKDLEYLISGDTSSNAALSISKLKAANYLNFGLKELVPSLWIESERDYNISAAYGITHWWFQIKEFYITRHNAPSDCHAVRYHMRILSVVSLKKFKRYGYAFLK
ncbi:hypothetical protein Tco_1451734, partial [Tanacetum coccineum]